VLQLSVGFRKHPKTIKEQSPYFIFMREWYLEENSFRTSNIGDKIIISTDITSEILTTDI
jgi:hypothetical protein